MAVQIAIIGCGGMANGHLNAYLTIYQTDPKKVELVAMCDEVKERADQFAERVKEVTGKKPAVFDDTDTMLATVDLDGVDICTSHAHHHINAIKCLNNGVNVMIEKPMGVTVKASHAIINAAKENNKIAATAENIRRMPSRRTAEWLMNEKQMLGDLWTFSAQHASYREPNPESDWHWRLDLTLGGGGMVMDSGAHYCDTLRYLFGDPSTVYARVCQFEDLRVTKTGEIVKNEQEDTWVATLNFKSGVIGLWTCTWAAIGHGFNHVVYYGSEGCLLDDGDIFHGPFDGAEVILKDGTRHSMENLIADYMASLSDEEKSRLFPHNFTDGVVLECYDFVDAIENNRPPELDAEVGLRAKSICEAIYESNACGQAVDYEEVVAGNIEVYQKPINERWGL
ncbi:Gfo/Idh/MocA family oxidoreductase [Candidatus Poribacteria bacterium]|nr:Gfo/Idh/MocA family oxidoreductase [Candidatus Poribacteria bacterium]